MLFYNWDKLYSISEGDSVEVVRILRMLVEKTVPRSYNDDMYKYYVRKHEFAGESYLLHPDILLYNSHRYTYRDLAMYLSLASLRPWAAWLTTQDCSLSAITVPIEQEVLHAYVEENPLLAMENGNIVFLFEEVGYQTLH